MVRKVNVVPTSTGTFPSESYFPFLLFVLFFSVPKVPFFVNLPSSMSSNPNLTLVHLNLGLGRSGVEGTGTRSVGASEVKRQIFCSFTVVTVDVSLPKHP